MKLVVIANTNTCRIYHYMTHPAKLNFLKELRHTENKLRSGDLASDRPGHYKTDQGARGAYSQHMETKEIHIDNFSREIAKELNKERIRNDYDELIVIAAPHMHGLLLQHINKHVKDLIINNIEKDVLHLPEHELIGFLQAQTQYHDFK